jgi:putative DNA methylase
MTRMIERWFPSSEVSANSQSGWGSGNSEVGIMTWFAKRPTAQAKAATICSLLPWPDDPAEQQRLQQLVRDAMQGRFDKADELRAEILAEHGGSASTLDPFSGRGMIPLETARLGLAAHAIDYSPVAVLASRLLADYPCHNWDSEPPVPFATAEDGLMHTRPRLVRDVDALFEEIWERHRAILAPYYPAVEGKQPWGYLWAITIPCQECSRRFPLIGQLDLRKPSTRRNRSTKTSFDDPGQSYYIEVDGETGTWSAVVHEGIPKRAPTRQVPPGRSKYDSNGRLAVCPFCGHAHDRQMQMRVLAEGKGQDAPLLAADIDNQYGKHYRALTSEELSAINSVGEALAVQPRFGPFLTAVPDEAIPPGNTWTVQATVYGTRTYGQMMNDRQTLSFIALARIIGDIGVELAQNGNSDEYVRALTGYAAAAMARKIRRSTRGATLQPRLNKVSDVFATESSLNFSFDYFEAGPGEGPGTWPSVSSGTLSSLEATMPPASAEPCDVRRGSAVSLPFRDRSISAIITDPPYDAMIDYSDASDLFYVWIKRALAQSWPEVALTAHELGVQEKQDEIIVKKGGTSNNDHRNREHYDLMITRAFAEAERVVAADGVVTIVFGHGEPEVWQRLLTAIREAGLVLTGAWPAKTESGGKVGFTNIVTTLTMACRPAPTGRSTGRKGGVEAEIRAEIRRRYPDWERWGLAPADMLMAAAGPAMEVVGRYSDVLDARGNPVDIYTFLPLARAAVQDAMAVEINHQPLDAFDARTRFALWWVRLYGRGVQAKSELRWQTLASALEIGQVRDLVPDAGSGVQFVSSSKFSTNVGVDSATIDVALILARVSEDGLEAIGEVLNAAGRAADDVYLWAAIQFLADKLPDNDPDAIALTRVLRTRAAVGAAVTAAAAASSRAIAREQDSEAQLKLL